MLEIRHSNWAWTMDMQVLGPGVCLSTPGVCGPALPPRLIYSIHHCGHCFKKNYWRKSSIHSSSYVYNQTIIQTTKIRNLRRIYFFSFFQINSGQDVIDLYCNHECKVEQVGDRSMTCILMMHVWQNVHYIYISWTQWCKLSHKLTLALSSFTM